MKKVKIIILIVSIAFCGLLLIYFHDEVSEGIYGGLKICLNTLIPSLFTFMILSSFIIESGCADIIGAKLNRVSKFLFYLPGNCITTVILSLIGGYPVGARNIKALYEHGCIDDSTAERMSLFCIGSGPAFIIGIVGCIMFNSYELGVIIFVSQSVTSILLGILLGLKSRKKGEKCGNILRNRHNMNLISDSLVQSTTDTSFAVINMCAFVLLFSAIIALLNATGISNIFSNLLLKLGLPNSIATPLLPSLLEITNGCYISSAAKASPLFFTFILSFGSVSVMFQIFSALKGIRFNKFKFVCCRVLHAIISVIITFTLIELLPHELSVNATLNSYTYSSFSNNILGSVALLAMCIIFVLCLMSKNTNKKLFNFNKKC